MNFHNIKKLNFLQIEVLISILDCKYSSYFNDHGTKLDSFTWCFASRGANYYFVESDFYSLIGRIRFDANQIAGQLLLNSK